MLMRDKIRGLVMEAAQTAGLYSPDDFQKIRIEYPDPELGDYSSNAALVLAKNAKTDPKVAANKLVALLDKSDFESIQVAGPGFINFKLKTKYLVDHLDGTVEEFAKQSDHKILLEYFQPNIAKPLHIGHLRTAIIGDAIKRMLQHLGRQVESDTHMGDWGTQFGYLIYAYKKHGDPKTVSKNPIEELNKLYVRLNEEAAADKNVHEHAKQEFVKLEQGDKENREIWKQFVDWSVEKFSGINELMDILPFDHHWPESFYEDKMPEAVARLKDKGLLRLSEGAQIVDLSQQGLGVAIIIKSDGGTTYLLRDLATYLFVKRQGFSKHLYVVDNRQSLHYRQLFAILSLLGEFTEGEGVHIDYGFISFKGEALSTRKGNMVLAEDVIAQAQEKVAQIIAEKNPKLKNKQAVIKAVAVGALKYFDLKHNRKSDIEFDWDEALDLEGDSGPYLQYSYARLSGILKKVKPAGSQATESQPTPTEREILFKLSVFEEAVQDAMADFMPNILAQYLFHLASLLNRFYHESPVLAEPDVLKKTFRLALVKSARQTLKVGLDLLGIKALEEM